MERIKTFERFILEKSGDTYDSGCVMLYFNFPEINKIHDTINPSDLYEENGDRSYGIEDEPHCTLLYGLKPDVSLDEVTSIVNRFKFGECKIHNASLFENAYDVLKFDVDADLLHDCNAALSKLPHTSTFPDYHPHLTIAYLKKGMGKKYCDMLNDVSFILNPSYVVYSEADGTKTKIEI